MGDNPEADFGPLLTSGPFDGFKVDQDQFTTTPGSR
jgi:hypothetical protein